MSSFLLILPGYVVLSLSLLGYVVQQLKMETDTETLPREGNKILRLLSGTFLSFFQIFLPDFSQILLDLFFFFSDFSRLKRFCHHFIDSRSLPREGQYKKTATPRRRQNSEAPLRSVSSFLPSNRLCRFCGIGSFHCCVREFSWLLQTKQVWFELFTSVSSDFVGCATLRYLLTDSQAESLTTGFFSGVVTPRLLGSCSISSLCPLGRGFFLDTRRGS